MYQSYSGQKAALPTLSKYRLSSAPGSNDFAADPYAAKSLPQD